VRNPIDSWGERIIPGGVVVLLMRRSRRLVSGQAGLPDLQG
jgi:hypothetical protein